MKLCECGCGGQAPVAKATSRRKGHVKGEPVRFISGHNARGVPKSDATLARMRAAWDGVPRPWLRGPRPGAWRDDTPDLQAAHSFLLRHHPKSGACEKCEKTGKTDYSFTRHPEPYTRNREDYRELCRSCHVTFDYEIGARGKALA